eukprot:EG_transcript_1921
MQDRPPGPPPAAADRLQDLLLSGAVSAAAPSASTGRPAGGLSQYLQARDAPPAETPTAPTSATPAVNTELLQLAYQNYLRLHQQQTSPSEPPLQPPPGPPSAGPWPLPDAGPPAAPPPPAATVGRPVPPTPTLAAAAPASTQPSPTATPKPKLSPSSNTGASASAAPPPSIAKPSPPNQQPSAPATPAPKPTPPPPPGAGRGGGTWVTKGDGGKPALGPAPPPPPSFASANAFAALKVEKPKGKAKDVAQPPSGPPKEGPAGPRRGSRDEDPPNGQDQPANSSPSPAKAVSKPQPSGTSRPSTAGAKAAPEASVPEAEPPTAGLAGEAAGDKIGCCLCRRLGPFTKSQLLKQSARRCTLCMETEPRPRWSKPQSDVPLVRLPTVLVVSGVSESPADAFGQQLGAWLAASPGLEVVEVDAWQCPMTLLWRLRSGGCAALVVPSLTHFQAWLPFAREEVQALVEAGGSCVFCGDMTLAEESLQQIFNKPWKPQASLRKGVYRLANRAALPPCVPDQLRTSAHVLAAVPPAECVFRAAESPDGDCVVAIGKHGAGLVACVGDVAGCVGARELIRTLCYAARHSGVPLADVTEDGMAQRVERLKALGNQCLQLEDGDFKAQQVYTYALTVADLALPKKLRPPLARVLFSNRSQVLQQRAAAGDPDPDCAPTLYRAALADADAAVALDRRWAKAHYRRATALRGLGQWQACAEALAEVWRLDPGTPGVEALLKTLQVDHGVEIDAAGHVSPPRNGSTERCGTSCYDEDINSVLAQLDPTFRTQRLELLVDVYRIRVHLDCRDCTYRRGVNRLDKNVWTVSADFFHFCLLAAESGVALPGQWDWPAFLRLAAPLVGQVFTLTDAVKRWNLPTGQKFCNFLSHMAQFVYNTPRGHYWPPYINTCRVAVENIWSSKDTASFKVHAAVFEPVGGVPLWESFVGQLRTHHPDWR